MWVTVYADASWRAHENRGGWGAYVRSDLGMQEAFGALAPPHVKDSVAAEIAALIKGAIVAVRKWPCCTGLHLVTDCTAARDALKYKAPPARRSDLRALQKAFAKAVAPRRYKLRWVKGHSSHDGARSWVNNRVDALSRKAYGRSA